MAKKYIITAGTSLLSRYFEENTGLGTIKVFDNYMGKLNLKGKDILEKKFDEWPTSGQPFLDAENILSWVKKHYAGKVESRFLFAELATLRKISPGKDDQFIILATETLRGVFCALMLATLISKPGNKIRTRYHDGISWIQNSIEVGTWMGEDRYLDFSKNLTTEVEVIQIRGLNPKNKSYFESNGISHLIRVLVNQIFNALQKADVPEIVFTGGFKASIPIITQVAGWMGGVPMTALYEESKDIVRIEPISSPPDRALLFKVLQVNCENATREDKWYELKEIYQTNERTTSLNYEALPGKEQRLFDPNTGKLNLVGNALRIYAEHAYDVDQETKNKIVNYARNG